jgi:Tol biopolymer transport system component
MFSPDGRSIAFAVGRRGERPVGPKHVWVADADGSHARPIIPLPAVGDPVWFDWIARDALLFVTETETGNAIWRVEVQGGKATLVGATPDRVLFARPSHDGRRVAYFKTSSTGSTYVSVLDLAAASEVQLTSPNPSRWVEMPIWSPDDRLLAVEMKDGVEDHVAVLPSAGGPVARLTTRRGKHWPGTWSPDGKRIGFAGFRDGVWNL